MRTLPCHNRPVCISTNGCFSTVTVLTSPLLIAVKLYYTSDVINLRGFKKCQICQKHFDIFTIKNHQHHVKFEMKLKSNSLAIK